LFVVFIDLNVDANYTCNGLLIIYIYVMNCKHSYF